MSPVKPGQVWRDNDPRAVGQYERHIEVLEVGEDSASVRGISTEEFPSGSRVPLGRNRVILLRRFKPTRSGYVLVRDVP